MIKIITLAFDAETQSFNEESLNEFISTHKIRFIRKEFFISQEIPYWTFVIDYTHAKKYEGREKAPEYKSSEISENEADEKLAEAIKKWRITEAKKQAYPPYIVLTNNQIDEIVSKKPMSKEALGKIAGIGKNKVSLYADAIIRLVKGEGDEQGLSDIQPVVQYDEPDIESDRTVSEVDALCTEQSSAESKS
ncbi:MAG TPA: HRDC domain-containing protein [Candidatus Cloacimonadota bacterium]|mgnify:CR=1 FL=1|nr:HRDC domain-containing protein [Candidatus Cloacimonadota bacterium]HPM02588.1 HRDC domain-containing protein [Candidatus Cloacimonadota bacterium]